MALTSFQAGILKLLAGLRKDRGESYVAGGIALNVPLASPRRSRDKDLFHDTEEALAATWAADRDLLRTSGYAVRPLRQTPSFVEAVVSRGSEQTGVQWARDSAYRFFPLIADDVMGLVLHPFDLATNRVLAMAGRLEVRDWIDVLTCDSRLQPFGYPVWAACGKDPGYNPQSLLMAARRLHYSQAEVDTLDFEGQSPDAASLGAHWHGALDAAAAICSALPPGRVGTCVISRACELFGGEQAALREALANGEVAYHDGSIGGSWPRVVTRG